MKTIEELKKYLRKELETKQEKLYLHYDMYKSTNDKLIKEVSKDFYTKYISECEILEKILSEIEG